MVGKLILV